MSLDVPPHLETIDPELTLAAAAALAAGQVIAAGADQVHEVELKGTGDVVSAIDREADGAALSVIRGSSQAPILSEELSPDTPHAADSLWIVDPLDGTSAFLHGVGNEYPSVLIAKMEHGRTKLGIALFPLTGEWFYSMRGRGAWRNGHRLCLDDTDCTLASAWVEMNQYGNAEYETSFFRQMRDRLRSDEGARLVTSSVPHAGVAMRIAQGKHLVAAIHDNNPDYVKQGPWDIAAVQVILEEAGGAMINHLGEPVDPFVAEPFIVARSERLARQILDLAATPAMN